MSNIVTITDFKSDVFKREINSFLNEGKIRNKDLTNLLILEKYIFNKFYGLLDDQKKLYVYNFKYPYYHGFIIDKIRDKYNDIYNKICKNLKI